MAPVRLTETAIRAAAKKAADNNQRVQVVDAATQGLRIRIAPSKRGTWSLALRDNDGRMRRYSLGQWPEWSISEAREAARRMRGRVKDDGEDPVAERRQRRAMGQDAAHGIGTLRSLVDQYGDKVGANKKSWLDGLRRITSVFADQLDRPLGLIRKVDLQLSADSYSAVSSASAAVRYLRPILKWGAERDLIALETTLVKPPAPVKRRNRVLSDAELERLLPVLRASDRPYAGAMLFMLLTLARREEVVQACWQDIDIERAEWRLPDTKSNRPHVVPLSAQAIDLICRPGVGEPPSLLFCTASGGALVNWDRETKKVMAASDTADWHRHDLRRTSATLLGELGVEPHLIEAALNHASLHSQLASLYNQARYRKQVRKATQLLADRLDALCAV